MSGSIAQKLKELRERMSRRDRLLLVNILREIGAELLDEPDQAHVPRGWRQMPTFVQMTPETQACLVEAVRGFAVDQPRAKYMGAFVANLLIHAWRELWEIDNRLQRWSKPEVKKSHSDLYGIVYGLEQIYTSLHGYSPDKNDLLYAVAKKFRDSPVETLDPNFHIDSNKGFRNFWKFVRDKPQYETLMHLSNRRDGDFEGNHRSVQNTAPVTLRSDSGVRKDRTRKKRSRRIKY